MDAPERNGAGNWHGCPDAHDSLEAAPFRHRMLNPRGHLLALPSGNPGLYTKIFAAFFLSTSHPTSFRRRRLRGAFGCQLTHRTWGPRFAYLGALVPKRKRCLFQGQSIPLRESSARLRKSPKKKRKKKKTGTITALKAKILRRQAVRFPESSRLESWASAPRTLFPRLGQARRRKLLHACFALAPQKELGGCNPRVHLVESSGKRSKRIQKKSFHNVPRIGGKKVSPLWPTWIVSRGVQPSRRAASRPRAQR